MFGGSIAFQFPVPSSMVAQAVAGSGLAETDEADALMGLAIAIATHSAISARLFIVISSCLWFNHYSGIIIHLSPDD